MVRVVAILCEQDPETHRLSLAFPLSLVQFFEIRGNSMFFYNEIRIYIYIYCRFEHERTCSLHLFVGN